MNKITKIKKYFEKVNPLSFNQEDNIVKIEKLGTGESNLNFLVQINNRKYLMRFDITNKSISNFKQEYEILKRLEFLNIAQKALFIDTSKKYFKNKFMILSYIEGKSLDKLKNIRYNKLAKKLANLHKLNIDFVNKAHSFDNHRIRIEKTIKKLKGDLKSFDAKNTIQEIFEIYHRNLKKELKNYKPVLTFCHGDVCLPNTLLSNNEFYLIDWELSGKMDPALELSYYFYEFGYTMKQREQFLKDYLKIRQDKTLKIRMKFTDFFVAFLGYFNTLYACFNISKKRGNKDYLKNANLKEYWEWGDYYLKLIFKLNLFTKDFEKKLKKDLNEIYFKLK